MTKRLIDLLQPLYAQLGITSVGAKMQFTREIEKYLQDDREHFVVLEHEDEPAYLSDPANGLVCKMAPVARRVSLDTDSFFAEEMQETLSVMLAYDGKPRLIYSVEKTPHRGNVEEQMFRFPSHFPMMPDFIMKGMEAYSPQDLRPVATELDRKVFCMAFHAFAHLTPHLHPSCVPHKTECAMFALKHISPESVTIDNKMITGKLLPLAAEGNGVTTHENNCAVCVTKYLQLLVTNDDARYVIKTKTVRTPYDTIPVDDDPLDFLTEAEDKSEAEAVYQYIELENIEKTLITHYT